MERRLSVSQVRLGQPTFKVNHEFLCPIALIQAEPANSTCRVDMQLSAAAAAAAALQVPYKVSSILVTLHTK